MEKTTGSPTALAGIDTYVSVTKVELGTKSDVEDEFTERGPVSIRIGFSGGLGGRTVLAFSPEPAEWLVDALIPGINATDAGGGLAESSLKEAANIVFDGFIDGWADYLDTVVDITTPTYVDDENNGPLDRVDAEGFENGGDDEHVLVFRNQLKATDNTIEFNLHMVSTASSIGTIVEVSGDDGALPVKSFAAFSETISNGATQVSKDIAAMAGIDTTAEMNRLSFVPIEGVLILLTDAVRRGVVLEFSGTPSGYTAILFDEPSAENITSSLLPGMEDDEAMRQGATQEIGNATASGFLDGWVNTLETTIDILLSRRVHDTGSVVIDPLTTDLTQSQEYASLTDSIIRMGDDEFAYDIYALPDEAKLCKALRQLSPTARPLRRGISIQVYTTGTPAAHSSRIKVGTAGSATSSDKNTLTTSGLGSCIGIALCDPETGVSELMRAMLPETDDSSGPTKFIDTGVGLLIVEMQAVDVDTDRIATEIAGGSTMFDFISADDDGGIGDRNVAATRTALDGFGIDVVVEDIDGSHDHPLELGSETGDLHVRNAEGGTHIL